MWQVTAADTRMCFRTMVFGCREASPLEARLLPMKGKVIVQKHHTGNWTRTKAKFSGTLLLSDPRREGVAALYTDGLKLRMRPIFPNFPFS